VHFSWFHYLIPATEKYPDHVLTAGLCTLLIALISLTAKAVAGTPEEALIPAPRFSLRNLFEFIVESLDNFVNSVVAEGGEIYVPVVASLFIYIFLNNVLGLFPGFSPATDNLNTTLAVGLFSFVLYNVEGLRAHGISYLKHFLGPIWWLAWLMLPIELISHMVRPLSLGLRLFGNMTGDHTVLSIFLNLVPVGVPMIFYGLGLFVCFVQAFVFSLLSMVYLSMATAHDH
jgi:F-type H+-transporting ATPase subunit a